MWVGESAVNEVCLVDPKDGSLPKHGYPVIEQDGECIGFVKMTALATSVAPTSIPVGAKRALVQCEGSDVRWKANATAPTSTEGMLLAAGAERVFTLDLANLRFIQVAAGAVLQISYFS